MLCCHALTCAFLLALKYLPMLFDFGMGVCMTACGGGGFSRMAPCGGLCLQTAAGSYGHMLRVSTIYYLVWVMGYGLESHALLVVPQLQHYLAAPRRQRLALVL